MRRPSARCPECRVTAPDHAFGCPETDVDWREGEYGQPMHEDHKPFRRKPRQPVVPARKDDAA